MKKNGYPLVVLLLAVLAFFIATCASQVSPTTPNDGTQPSSHNQSSLPNSSAPASAISDTSASSPNHSSVASIMPVSSIQNVSSVPASVSSQPQSRITVELASNTNRVVAGNAINFSYTVESTDAIVSVRVDLYGDGTIDTTLSNAQAGTFSKVFDAVGSFYTVIVAQNSQGTSGRDSLRIHVTPFIPDTGIVDSTPPVITLNPPLNDTINLGETWTDPGYEATDNLGNNITSFVERIIYDRNRTIRTVPHLIANEGIYTIEYTVEDFFGNVAETRVRTVVVIVIDVTPPVIDLVGPINMDILRGQPYTEPGFTVHDDRDNSSEITANVEVTVRNSANAVVNINTFTSTTGTYTIEYNVSDRAGNRAITVIRTVTVITGTTNAQPSITLLGPNPVLIPLRGGYTEHGATANDAEDGNLTSNITINAAAINTASTGSYNVIYSVTDNDGATTTVERLVRVIGEDGSSFATSFILTPGAQRTVANRTNNHFTFTAEGSQTFLFTASGFTWNFIELTVYDGNNNVIPITSNNQTNDGRAIQFTTTHKGQYYIMIYDEYRNMNPANIRVLLTSQ